MKINRVQLSSKEILEKDFKTSLRGYNQKDVDEFLDVVMQDYEALNNEIQQLKQENDRFKRSSAQEPEHKKPTQPQQVNYDVLKRLSNIERAVFGQKSIDEDN
ncbi:MAG TPA: cell division regulator GpsB [Pseudogracilibacillus sp.]|nr:cell division regulator GpsB [Pseudogracilibacillus sp.]